MTLIAGVNVGLYAVVAADSRETFYFEGQEPVFKDDCEKVRTTPLGLGAGSGISTLVQRAIENLSALSPELLYDDEEVGGYFYGFLTSSREVNAPYVTDARLKAHLDRAGWILTRRENRQLIVRRHHPDREQCRPEYFPAGTPCVLLPHDVPSNLSMAHEMTLLRRLVPCKKDRDIERSMSINLKAIAQFFDAIRAMSVGVGPAIQIGFHFHDGTTDILPIEPIDSLL